MATEESAKNKIMELGYLSANEIYSAWLKQNADDEDGQEYYPLDEKGNPDEEKYFAALSEIYWELGCEEIETDPLTKNIMDELGPYETGEIYFDGVRRFVDEKFNK